MIDTEQVRAARRRLTDAMHAMHSNTMIRVDERLARQLDEAWETYDKTLTTLERELLGILAEHVGEDGESEGAVQVLRRLEFDHNLYCPRRARSSSPRGNTA